MYLFTSRLLSINSHLNCTSTNHVFTNNTPFKDDYNRFQYSNILYLDNKTVSVILLNSNSYKFSLFFHSSEDEIIRSPAEIVGSKPTGGMDICLL